jgi:hypothetical protein
VAQPENAHLSTYARLFFSHGNIAFTWCMYICTHWQIMRIRRTGGNCSFDGLSLLRLPLFLWSTDLLTLPLPLSGIPINSSRSLSTYFFIRVCLCARLNFMCAQICSYLQVCFAWMFSLIYCLPATSRLSHCSS